MLPGIAGLALAGRGWGTGRDGSFCAMKRFLSLLVCSPP